jgi:predicted AAA+ superfamily ATPase
MNYKRNIRFNLEKALKRSPVVLLTGARQTGKTTLMKELAQEKKYHYVSFDDMRYLLAAQNDPMGFIADIPKPVILDEIQRAPELFLAIKYDVDNNRIPGRYALTGSANPLLIPRLGDSLAGRMEILTMYPLSQGELLNRFDHFIDSIFQEDSITGIPSITCTQQELFHKILTGGYPLIQHVSWEDKEAWFNNYISAILQKDILELSQIEDATAIPRLLSILAAHAGSLLNVSEISRQSGITTTTLNRYLILLKTVFMIYLQQPWHSNLIRRVIKSPKAYLVDTGLLSWLLAINNEKIAQIPHKGHLLENFVFNELQKQATWNKTRVQLYHFRTPAGIEVDMVLERPDGKIIGIEVKSNQNITPKDLKGLLYLKEHVKDKWHRGIVLYTGNESIPLGHKITALPISTLWSFAQKDM